MDNIKIRLKKFFTTGSDITKALCIALIFTVLLEFCALDTRCDQVRESVFRLHVIANSDSTDDQELKLKVRDRIIRDSAHLFEGVSSDDEAIEISRKNICAFEKAAKDEITANGYDYSVSVSVSPSYFGTRVYDNITLPAGDYEALRVVIGEGKGKNWWCVMFPPMCLSPADKEADNKQLDETLNDDGLTLVTGGEKYKAKFRAVEIYEQIKHSLRNFFS